MTAWGHVWTAPAVQEESDYQRSVRVRSCIRPVVAWRITSVAMQPPWPRLSSHDPKTGFPIDGLDRFASMPSSPLQFVNAQTLPHFPAARLPTPLPQAQAPDSCRL